VHSTGSAQRSCSPICEKTATSGSSGTSSSSGASGSSTTGQQQQSGTSTTTTTTTGKTIVQKVTFSGSLSTYKGSLKKLTEEAYGYTLGIFTTTWATGCAVTSTAAASRRANYAVTMNAQVSAAKITAAESVSAVLANNIATLNAAIATVKSANTQYSAVTAPTSTGAAAGSVTTTGNCMGGIFNTGGRCRSSTGSGNGYDCWAGSSVEKCECSEGTAWTTGNTLTSGGTKVYEYYCCTGGAALTIGSDPKQAGEKCGDYALDTIILVIILIIVFVVCFFICCSIGICYCERTPLD